MSTFLSTADPESVIIPELASTDDTEPTLTVYVVLALDGADQFHAEHCAEEWADKVQPFRDIVRQAIVELAGDSCSVLTSRYPDAEFAKFVGPGAIRGATAAVACVLRRLTDSNATRQLNWIDQMHARVALSSESWSNAICLLQQALRDEVMVDPVDWKTIPSNEQATLAAGMCIRAGADEVTWQKILKQLDQGIEFPSDSYVAKKLSKFTSRDALLDNLLNEYEIAKTG